jgi:hypothetical protein
LQCISEGPVQEIGGYTTDQGPLKGDDLAGNFFLNDMDASTLKDVTVWTRLGAVDQEPIFHFREINNEYGQRFRMKAVKQEGRPFEWTTKEPVHAITVQFEFPGGLYTIDKTTGEEQRTGAVFQVIITNNETDEEVFDDFIFFAGGAGKIRKQRFWWQWQFETPEFSRYHISVQRRDPENDSTDIVELIAINEIQFAALKYPGLALIGWKIKASEQISGGFPRIIVKAKGLKVQTTSGLQWSSNPFDIIRGILLDKNWGLGRIVDASDLDDASGQEFENWCDELIAPYTGAETLEKRAELDIILDAPRGAWEVLQALAATARGSLLKIGSLIKFKIDKPELPTQLFTSGSIIRDSVSIQNLSRRSRPNRISVNFRDRDNHFKQASQLSEFAFIDESLGELNQKEVDMWGIIRRTQASRLSGYLLRHEQLAGSRIKFSAPISAIVSEPGDVVNVQLESSRNGKSGRIIGLTPGGFVIMDRKFTFTLGVVYTYREKNPETGEVLAKDFNHIGEDTSALPFAPLHGGEVATGREYTVGEKFIDVKPWRLRSIGTGGDDFTRDIEAIEYVPEVYSDEATDIAVTDESSDEEGVSTLTVEWTSAGEGIAYNVYTSPVGNPEASSLVETTAGISVVFNLIGLLYDDNVQIIIQSLDPSGGRIPISTAPSIVYKIRRENNGTAILDYPGNVQNPVWTDLSHADGNLYSLAWDAVAGADGYEIRAGAWPAGRVVYQGAAASAEIRTGRVAREYFVRAYIGTEYSSSALITESPVTGYQGYSVESVAANSADLDGASSTNGVPITLFGSRHISQVDPEIPIAVTTAEIDLGSSAPTHVSLDVSAMQRYIQNVAALEIFSDAISWTVFGEIRQQYHLWDFRIRYKATAGAAWSELAFTDGVANESIVLTGRYFQFAFTGATLRIPPRDNPEITEIVSRAMLSGVKFAMFRTS